MTHSFFDEFEEARHELTIGDEDAPDLNVLQPGLIAVFFMDKAYERRQAIAQALQMYCERYGDKLKWGYFGGAKMKGRKWTDAEAQMCRDYILSTSTMEYVEFCWSSEVGFGYVGDYVIDAVSPAAWYEQVHQPLSAVRFYLPIEELNGSAADVQSMLLNFCTLLKPLHGYMGLGIQQSYEHEDFQAMEYELAQEFSGLEVGSPWVGDKAFRAGFKSVNWYTILDTQWINKLGGSDAIRAQLNDERIQLLPYANGLIIKAGEWPALGWVKKNPYPELYVEVNRVLKPARAPEVQSFHYGSVAGEIRFGTRSSNEWMKRFDDAPEVTPAPPQPQSQTTVESRSNPSPTV